jgi:hypothetical protein
MNMYNFFEMFSYVFNVPLIETDYVETRIKWDMYNLESYSAKGQDL